MAKPLQYCKVISLQIIKINGKKNNQVFGLNQGQDLRKGLEDFKTGNIG